MQFQAFLDGSTCWCDANWSDVFTEWIYVWSSVRDTLSTSSDLDMDFVWTLTMDFVHIFVRILNALLCDLTWCTLFI